MNWQQQLLALEKQKHWDEAIELMQNVIRANPNDMDAYINLIFFLMDILVEQDCDPSKQDDYEILLKWYFDESYAKFSQNAEYLYFTGKTAVMGPWYFGIDQKDYERMLEQAALLDFENLLYKQDYYWNLSENNPTAPELIAYTKAILDDNSALRKHLLTKCLVGEYILGMEENWCKRVLRNAERLEKTKMLYN